MPLAPCRTAPRDHLEAIHRRSVAALVTACEQAGVRRLVQISAIGADIDSDNAFFRTKAEGDRAVASSSLEWTILRPGLVIAPGAYGGTALFRAGCVSMVGASRACGSADPNGIRRGCRRGRITRRRRCLARGQIIDLVEERARSLGAVLLEFRAWLGLPKAPVMAVPAIVGRLAGMVADGLGLLGWRSPLRSAALAALEKGVTGTRNPGPKSLVARRNRWKQCWRLCRRMFRSGGSRAFGC